MEAAEIALNAVGKQDTHLSRADPDHSLFKYDGARRHANFTKFHRTTNVNNPGLKSTWPFGETIKVTMHPKNMGDLLSNMYVRLKFPRMVTYPGTHLADQLGRHLLATVTMRVDELEIEKYHDDWGIIYDELYLDASEKRTKRYTINRNLAEGTALLQPNKFLVQYDSELMIPVPLFFSRKYEGDEYATNLPNRPYFPTCAVHRQKIEFELVFRPQSFFTDTPDVLSLEGFDIITEEMTVSQVERTYLTTTRQVFITDIVKKHPTIQTVPGSDKVRLELVPNVPVKTLNWFLRDEAYENENVFSGGQDLSSNAFANRFTFSNVLTSAKIFVNGQDLPNVPTADHTFFKYLVPLACRLSRPFRDIYTYAFSMNPINVEPSGSLDFSRLRSNRTVLDVSLRPGTTETFTLHLYYVGYQTFVFERGFMSLAY